MYRYPQQSSRWLRFCINAGFVLVLVSAVFARASATTLEKANGKAVQHGYSEYKGAANWIDSDPPESKAVCFQTACRKPASVPRVLGQVQVSQFSPMVLQLRDRLMHAPPVVL